MRISILSATLAIAALATHTLALALPVNKDTSTSTKVLHGSHQTTTSTSTSTTTSKTHSLHTLTTSTSKGIHRGHRTTVSTSTSTSVTRSRHTSTSTKGAHRTKDSDASKSTTTLTHSPHTPTVTPSPTSSTLTVWAIPTGNSSFPYTHHCVDTFEGSTCTFYAGSSPWSECGVVFALACTAGILELCAWGLWRRWWEKRRKENASWREVNTQRGRWFGFPNECWKWESLKDPVERRSKKPQRPLTTWPEQEEGWTMPSVSGGSSRASTPVPDGRFNRWMQGS
ncbi:MAG: hypothetical protein M1834_000903 [Cirrosporium novae-zelandiae]|nr:MAG: hypothetical protein M1834_000903 [Cirrosporium novae-zelandiae]